MVARIGDFMGISPMSPDFARMLREKLEAYVNGWRSQPSKMGKLGMVYVLLYYTANIWNLRQFKEN